MKKKAARPAQRAGTARARASHDDSAAARVGTEITQPDASQAERLARLQTLTRLNRLITSSLEMDDVLREIARAAATLMHGASASFALVDEATRTIELRAWSDEAVGNTYPRTRLDFGEGILGWIATHRQPVNLIDAGADPRFVAPEWLQAHGFRSYLGVPVMLEGALLAILSLNARTPFVLTLEDESLLDSFVGQAAVAIKNARLYTEAERQRRETELTAEITRAISASLDLDTVFQRITDGAKDLVGSDIAMICLREGDADSATVRYRVGSRYSEDPTFSIQPGKGLGGQALVTGRPARTDDYAGDPRFGKEYLGAIRRDGVVSAMVVPVVTDERAGGVLYVANRTPRLFTDRDETVLLRLAEGAAIALKNAQRYASERESERRYRSIFENANDSIVTYTLDGTITDVNPAVTRLLGYSREELIGRHAAEFANPRTAAEIADRMRRALRGENLPPIVEVVTLSKDGRQVTAEGRMSPMRDPQGNVIGFQAIYHDVTERRRAEEALHRSEEQLRQAQKMEAVGRLAGGIAHDFNNLLMVITGRGEILLRRLAAADPMRRDLELIKKTADRAAALTRQLLAFSRKQMLQPKVLDLNGIVASVAQMLQRLIGEDIDLVTLLEPNLGSVRVDPAQMEQIILNLAVNARDAMPQGGRLAFETANIDLDEAFAAANPGASAGSHVLLQVSDTGEGISADVKPHIFEPFFTTKEVGKGTGLGLATVYGIVKQHDGYIAVDSAPSAGATFRIYLKRVDEAPADVDAGAAGAREPRGWETVLLVEDEDGLRELVREILASGGYKVLAAASPDEGLEVARRHGGPIHLLLTDVVMPQMSGRALVERLAPEHPEMKVLYMSGYAADAIASHGILEAGAILLPKPFSSDALARKVREVLTP